MSTIRTIEMGTEQRDEVSLLDASFVADALLVERRAELLEERDEGDEGGGGDSHGGGETGRAASDGGSAHGALLGSGCTEAPSPSTATFAPGALPLAAPSSRRADSDGCKGWASSSGGACCDERGVRWEGWEGVLGADAS